MSNFKCEQCGAICSDTPEGYVTGCCHYPPDAKAMQSELAGVKAQRDALLESMHNIRRHLKIVSGGMHEMSGAWQIANKAIAEQEGD